MPYVSIAPSEANVDLIPKNAGPILCQASPECGLIPLTGCDHVGHSTRAPGVAGDHDRGGTCDRDREQLRLLDAEDVDLSSFFTDAEFDAMVGTGARGGADENAAVEPGPTDSACAVCC